MNASRMQRLVLILGSVTCAPGVALGDHDSRGQDRVVDCARGESIQRAIDQRNPDHALTLVIRGFCNENVTVKRDDVTLAGEGGTVSGTISIIGARRLLIQRLTVTGPGAGVVASENAAVTIEDSFLEHNGTNAVVAQSGAHVTVRRSSLSHNGTEQVPDTGRGIELNNGLADVRNSQIIGNRSDGIAVFNNSYARLMENTIESNGRPDAGEAGIQVNRSRVRAHGNTIRNNTGIAALFVVNHSDYRTGTGLNAADFPDNPFAFERIEHPVGVHAGESLVAVGVNNSSLGDFRQVHIVGSISVGDHSMMQVRGDQVAPNQPCSTIDTTGGFAFVSGRFGLLRLRATHVTPGTIGVGGPFGLRDGATVCP